MVPQGIVMSTSNVLTVEFYTNGSTMSLNYASAYYTARSSSGQYMQSHISGQYTHSHTSGQ